MHKPTFDVDAASILFNLSGYRVVSATPGVGVEQPRQVLIETTTSEGACPSCGVLSSRIQARPTQRVKDVPCGGERLDVLVRKRRYACRESLCPRRSFTEETEQLPARARVTTRLTEQVISVCRAEPRSIVFTDLDDGAILDVVDGRRGKVVTSWLAARPRWWRRRVQVVALDMSSEFRAAVRKALPRAKVSVDHWHVVRLANEMVTKVRRRRVWELHEHQGTRPPGPHRHRHALLPAALGPP